jgi:hypothetical protein
MKTYDVKTYSEMGETLLVSRLSAVDQAEACELTRRFFPWLEDLVLYAVEVQP